MTEENEGQNIPPKKPAPPPGWGGELDPPHYEQHAERLDKLETGDLDLQSLERKSRKGKSDK